MIKKALTWGLMALALAAGHSVQAAERLAHGLIVKLKDSRPASVVQWPATVRPREAAAQTRLRLSAVTQRHGVSFLAQRPTAFGAQVIHNNRPMRMVDAEAQAARLRQDPDVEWVVVNEIARPQAALPAESDPEVSNQEWIRDRATGGYPNIPAAFARLTGRTLSPVVVAVLDTGVVDHPDLQGRLLGGWDFVSEVEYGNDGSGRDSDASDPGDYLTGTQAASNPALYDGCEVSETSSWHGTMTTGIVAAGMGNGVGMVGVLGPLAGAPVLPVRVAGNCGAAVSDIIDGMLWAAGIDFNGSPARNVHRAKVISLSFGGEPGCVCNRVTAPTSAACLYVNAVQTLRASGSVLVAAAGNGDGVGGAGYSQASRPASCAGVIPVASVALNGAKAGYSNLVTAQGVAAPGMDSDLSDPGVLTLSNSGAQGPVPGAEVYTRVEGTSFATPMVAGALALMWSVNPDLTVDQVVWGLRNHGVRPHVAVSSPVCSATNTSTCRCTTDTCGAGLLDVDRAVAWAVSPNFTGYVPPASTETSAGGGGGGGGSVDACWLAGLAFMVVVAHARPARNARASRKG